MLIIFQYIVGPEDQLESELSKKEVILEKGRKALRQNKNIDKQLNEWKFQRKRINPIQNNDLIFLQKWQQTKDCFSFGYKN